MSDGLLRSASHFDTSMVGEHAHSYFSLSPTPRARTRARGAQLGSLASMWFSYGVMMDRSSFFSLTPTRISACNPADAGRGMVHRDVKCANCFIGGDDSIKLGDFGATRELEHNHADIAKRTCRTPAGTPMYMAPEV